MRFFVRILPGLVLLLVGCRTCPMQTCHVRKVHLHSGVKYRGQPLWKMQNPEIGQKIKTHGQKAGSNPQDKKQFIK